MDGGRLIVFIRDISLRRQAEQMSRERTSLVSAVFEAIPDGIVAVNMDREIVSINKGFTNTLGYDLEDLKGQTTAYFYASEEEFKRQGELRYNLSAEELRLPYMVQYRHKDGHSFAGETIGVPMLDVDGNKIGFIGVIRDITQKAHLENQLHQSQKLQTVGTMVGGIAHELNNVLQSIFLYGSLVRDNLPDNTDTKTNFLQLMKDAERARDIVKQVLTFSRKSSIELKPQYIHDMVRDAVSIQKAATLASIQVHHEIDETCGMVLSDATQIHQIILNLCNNALQSMAEKGGVLTVKMTQVEAAWNLEKPAQPAVEITVTDTGEGMGKEIMDKVFDPFFTTKRIGAGTGLGLSVVHGIVETLGGQISVKSKVDHGTSFRVIFPVVDKDGRVIKV